MSIKFAEIGGDLSLINYMDVKTFNDSNSITQRIVNANGSLRRHACMAGMIFDEKFSK